LKQFNPRDYVIIIDDVGSFQGVPVEPLPVTGRARIFSAEYGIENMLDLEEDLHEAFGKYHNILPRDKNGFVRGSIKVEVTWTDSTA
jgi:hypothetical protein